MSQPTRRTVVRTGVWAVPAVATAAAAPAFAGTGSPCVSLICVVSACKQSSHVSRGTTQGTSSSCKYTVKLKFTSCDCKTVSIISWDMTGTPASSVSPSSFVLNKGTTTKSFTVTESGTPGGSLTVSYEVGGVVTTTTVALPSVGTCSSSW